MCRTGTSLFHLCQLGVGGCHRGCFLAGKVFAEALCAFSAALSPFLHPSGSISLTDCFSLSESLNVLIPVLQRRYLLAGQFSGRATRGGVGWVTVASTLSGTLEQALSKRCLSHFLGNPRPAHSWVQPMGDASGGWAGRRREKPGFFSPPPWQGVGCELTLLCRSGTCRQLSLCAPVPSRQPRT